MYFLIDKTPPRVDECISPEPIVSKSQAVEVNVKAPVFSDNSGEPVEVASSHRNGKLFSRGKTKITYKAFDGSNNNSTCVIEVNIIRKYIYYNHLINQEMSVSQ